MSNQWALGGYSGLSQRLYGSGDGLERFTTVPHRFVWLVACALLSASAFAEERAMQASAPHPARHTRPNHNPRSSRTNNDSAPVHSQNRNETRYPDFSILESLNTTDLMEIQKLSEAGNAPPSGGPGSGRTAFLLQREHDAAIKLLTTNIVLRVKLSAEGVHLHLAF